MSKRYGSVTHKDFFPDEYSVEGAVDKIAGRLEIDGVIIDMRCDLYAVPKVGKLTTERYVLSFWLDPDPDTLDRLYHDYLKGSTVDNGWFAGNERGVEVRLRADYMEWKDGLLCYILHDSRPPTNDFMCDLGLIATEPLLRRPVCFYPDNAHLHTTQQRRVVINQAHTQDGGCVFCETVV